MRKRAFSTNYTSFRCNCQHSLSFRNLFILRYMCVFLCFFAHIWHEEKWRTLGAQIVHWNLNCMESRLPWTQTNRWYMVYMRMCHWINGLTTSNACNAINTESVFSTHHHTDYFWSERKKGKKIKLENISFLHSNIHSYLWLVFCESSRTEITKV